MTDDEGSTATLIREVVVTDDPPPLVGPIWRAGSSSDANTARPAWGFPRQWRRRTWTTRGTVSDGNDVRTWVLTRTAGARLEGASVTVVLDATSNTSMVLLA